MAQIIGLSGSNKIVTKRDLTIQEIGIANYTEVFVTTTFGAGIGANYIQNEGAAIPQIYSQSARYPFMNLANVRISQMAGDLVEVTTNYVGFPNSIYFAWPPTISPTIPSNNPTPANNSTIPLGGASNPSKVAALVRCAPAGREGSDYLHYPLQVEIEFIDSVANEYSLLTTWKTGQTPMPTNFRGISIPPPTKAPYKEKPKNNLQTGDFITYLGVVLKSINIDRMGNKYNRVKAIFADGFFITTYTTA